ncbi:hypothetical protein AGMMS50230_02700 [Spirochaetia bacterium]|nr:hypothetical protein AGMMS50230_02700 [Spirochaetia bacterium]
MKKKYESEQLMVIHQSAEVLFKLGLLDAAEMKEFDDDCLVHDPASPSTATSKQKSSPVYANPRR